MKLSKARGIAAFLFGLVRENRILSFILLLAMLLRFVGAYPGYNTYHADETVAYTGAVSIIKTNSLFTGWYFYGTVPSLISALFYKVLFIPYNWLVYYLQHFTDVLDGILHFPPTALEAKRIFDYEIVGIRSQHALFWSRYVTAAFGVGCVFLTYLLGKKAFGKGVGLIAAFLLTFNFKHVVNSHLTLPDIYNSFFLLLSLLLTLRLLRRQSIKNYVLAGIAAGVSFSVKYQLYAILSLGLAHLFLSFPKRLFRPGIFIAALLIPATFLLLNPYYFINFEEAWASNLLDVKRYALGTNNINVYPLWYMYHFDYGAIQLILFVVGLVWAGAKSFQKALFLFAPIVLFIYVFFYYSTGGFFVRNIITTTPLLLIFVGFAIWHLYLYVAEIFPKRIAGGFLVLALLGTVYVPGKNSLISSYNYTKPWNYSLMSDWLRDNLPQDAVVAATPWDLPTGEPKRKKTEFEIRGSFSLAEHKENGADWSLISSHWSPGFFYSWMNFGLSDISRFWDKPMDLLRNTYHGIATEEFFRYQAHSVTKPWQASDANLIIAKIPVWTEGEMREIKTFTFDADEEGWTEYWQAEGASELYTFDGEQGQGQKGSLVYLAGSNNFATTRITSPLISVEPGRLYKITGFIKVERNLTSSEREGFIRIDFYSSDNPNIAKVGLQASVSARVYGTTDWVQKAIVERAPEGVKFMTVSFQNSSLSQQKMWLDDVLVQESQGPVEDITESPPYNKVPIDLNPFYPNSHGNL